VTSPENPNAKPQLKGQPNSRLADLRRKTYRVPRRYGIGTVLIVIAAFSVMLGVLRLLGAHPILCCIIIGLFVVVAIAQLIGPESPRKASMIGGALYVLVVGIVLSVMSPGGGVVVLLALIIATPLGALLGYVAGGLFASIFLCIDAANQLRDSKASDTSESPPPDNGKSRHASDEE
jgi:MFS family permease